MQATRLIPAALAELTNPPAFIVFVGLRVVDLTIVEEFGPARSCSWRHEQSLSSNG